MSDQELKPCPFCHQPFKIVDGDMIHPSSWCILSGTSWPVENTATWNKRTPDPMLEELAGALDRLLNFTAGEWLKTMEDSERVLIKYQQSKV